MSVIFRKIYSFNNFLAIHYPRESLHTAVSLHLWEIHVLCSSHIIEILLLHKFPFGILRSWYTARKIFTQSVT